MAVAESSLTDKIRRGSIWVMLTTLVTRGMQLVAEVVLARVLMPEDFGLMAVALAILAFSEGTVATGFDSAIIQKQENPETYLNSAWTIELIRNLILFLVIFLLAPSLGSFFKEEQVVPILRVLSTTFIIQGFRNIGIVYFRKELDFKRQFVIESLPLLIYVFTVVPLALSLRSVWALVWAVLLRRIVFIVMSYLMHPHRPRWELKREKVTGLFHFGKWIFLSSIIGMVRDQGVTMFVSKSLGMALLGVYNRAMVFSSLIFRDLTEVVWKVGYSAYAKLQHDPEGFRQVYLRTIYLVTFVAMPVSGMLFLLAEPFTLIVLTEKWLAMVPVLKLLSVSSILLLLGTPSGIAFQAHGKPDISTKIAFLGIIIILASIVPFSSTLGITGVALSILISALVVTPVVYWQAHSLIGFTAFDFFRPVLFAGLNTGMMILSMMFLQSHFLTVMHIGSLLLLATTGGLSYLLGATVFERWFHYRIYSSFKNSVSAFMITRS